MLRELPHKTTAHIFIDHRARAVGVANVLIGRVMMSVVVVSMRMVMCMRVAMIMAMVVLRVRVRLAI